MFTHPQQPPHSVSTCTEEVHPHQKLSVIPGVQHYPKKPLHTQIKHHLTNECLLTVHNTNHVIICFYYWIAIVSIPVCVQPPFTRKLRGRLCLANFPEVKFDPTPLFSLFSSPPPTATSTPLQPHGGSCGSGRGCIISTSCRRRLRSSPQYRRRIRRIRNERLHKVCIFLPLIVCCVFLLYNFEMIFEIKK